MLKFPGIWLQLLSSSQFLSCLDHTTHIGAAFLFLILQMEGFWGFFFWSISGTKGPKRVSCCSMLRAQNKIEYFITQQVWYITFGLISIQLLSPNLVQTYSASCSCYHWILCCKSNKLESRNGTEKALMWTLAFSYITQLTRNVSSSCLDLGVEVLGSWVTRIGRTIHSKTSLWLVPRTILGTT